jgi:DNA-binding CsgD family transcriptional regulator
MEGDCHAANQRSSDLDFQVSNLLLTLYREAKRRPLAGWREWALKRARDVLSFDSAAWVECRTEPELEFHSLCAVEQPDGFLGSFRKYAAGSPMLGHMLDRPGRACDLYESIGREALLESDAYRTHFQRFGIEHIVCTNLQNAHLGISTFIAFYRHDYRQPFSAAERFDAEVLSHHLLESYRTALFFRLAQHRAGRLSDDCGYALCNGQGLILQGTGLFGDLLRAEWPDWQGPRLPEAVRAGVTESGEFVGRGFRVEVKPVETDLFLLEVLAQHGLDRLTPAERRVAEQLANGLTYKQTARELGIAVSTVTNHANRIYRKLKIGNKVQLAQKLEGRAS